MNLNGKLDLRHKFSILLSEEFNGITNDLIAINNDTLLITESLPFPDPIEGRY